MAEQVTIARLDIDVDAAVKESARLLSNQNSLKDSLRNLRKEGKASSEEYARQDAALRKASKAYSDQRKVVTSLLSVNGDLNALLETENKTTTELRNNRNQLIAIAQSIKGDTEEEIALRKRLNDGIDENTKAQRAQSSEFVVGKDSVGEYTQAIEKAIPANSLLGQSINFVKDVLNIVNPIYKAYSSTIKEGTSLIRNAAAGTEGLTKAQKAQVITTNIATGALKLFRVALISTGIGAIVVALASLVSFLGSTQEGIDKVNQVLKPLEVIFGRLFGLLQDFGKVLFDAFSNPKQLIEDLGDSIKQNLEVRFNAVVKIFNRIRNFDFKGIGEDLVEAGTGVEDLAEKTANFFGDAKAFLEDSIALGQQLADIQVQIEKNEINNILRVAELNNLVKEQNKIAEDVTKNQVEREQAVLRTIEASNEILRIEREQLDLKIQQAELENSINDTSREDEKALAELRAERLQSETAQLELQTTQINKLNTIRREIASNAAKAAAEEAKSVVDAANLELQIFQEKNLELLQGNEELNQTIVNARVEAEKFIRDESLKIVEEKLSRNLINEREAELERLQIINDFNEQILGVNDSFREQEREKKDKELEADLERKQIEADADFELKLLQAESNEEREILQLERKKEREIAFAEEIGASTTAIIKKFELEREAIEKKSADKREQIERAVQQNKLQTLSSALGQAAGLLSESTGLAKVLGIAQATIDTYIGANKALATLPPPFGGIQAGLTIAAGLGNVAKIGGVQFAEGGLQEIGGNYHSAGGTKFMGEDGTRFEAEKGELIGVMNRKAAAAFMRFNNRFRSGRSYPGFYEGGGIFSSSNSGLTPSSVNTAIQQEGIDYDLLAMKVAQANQSLPTPKLIVSDFNEVNDKVVNVEAGANV